MCYSYVLQEKHRYFQESPTLHEKKKIRQEEPKLMYAFHSAICLKETKAGWRMSLKLR